MWAIKQFLMIALCALLPVPSALAQDRQDAAKAKQDVTIVIQRREVRFISQKTGEEMRLQVFDQSGEVAFDSGAVQATEVDWPFQTATGEALKSGLYAYTLSTKEAGAAEARLRRGHFIVDRAKDRDDEDKLWVTSQNESGVGAELTVAKDDAGAIAGAAIGERTVGQRAEIVDRDASDRAIETEAKSQSQPGKGTGKVAAVAAGTIGMIAKFTSATDVGNSVMTELNGNIGIGLANPVAKVHVLNGTPGTSAVYGESASGPGVYGKSTSSRGVFGESASLAGVWGASGSGPGLVGVSASGYGVQGTSAGAAGFAGYFTNTGGGSGVYSESPTGRAIWGKSTSSRGVFGESVSNVGVWGVSVSSTGVIGVSTSGYGVDGSSASVGGYGGHFSNTAVGGTALKVDGKASVGTLEINNGADFAENFEVSAEERAGGSSTSEIRPGMVVAIDPANPGKLNLSRRAYDRRVAGVISGAGGVKPGMTMGQSQTLADGKYPVALSGRVYVWVDAARGAIHPGDLLTTSSTPGHAMKVGLGAKAQGAIIGKAMTGLKSGKGLVLTLVTLQ
jgi:hypothetical protein